jgi:hypothetical protein
MAPELLPYADGGLERLEELRGRVTKQVISL